MTGELRDLAQLSRAIGESHAGDLLRLRCGQGHRGWTIEIRENHPILPSDHIEEIRRWFITHRECGIVLDVKRSNAVDEPQTNDADNGYAAPARNLRDQSDRGGDLEFPAGLLRGVAGHFAELYSGYIESPPAFLFFSFLTCLGSTLADRLCLESELRFVPRFYVLLLGDSATDRKSTSVAATMQFFEEFLPGKLNVCCGTGSAEGLAESLKENPKLLLTFDEFKSFVAKTRIEASVLLPCVNSLFEATQYSNRTKNLKIELKGVHLSLLAASTLPTFQAIWSPTFEDIGFTNRLFLVTAKGQRKFPLPGRVPSTNKAALAKDVKRIIELCSDSLVMTIKEDAQELFSSWYLNLPDSPFSKRLDTYFLRLAPLLALTLGKKEVDLTTAEWCRSIINWQLEVRERVSPIDAEGAVAKMENAIRRALGKKRPPLRDRELKVEVHAYRAGLWIYENALRNMATGRDPEIFFDSKTKTWNTVPSPVTNKQDRSSSAQPEPNAETPKAEPDWEKNMQGIKDVLRAVR